MNKDTLNEMIKVMILDESITHFEKITIILPPRWSYYLSINFAYDFHTPY